ncbi:MAG: hypothetical protein VX768_21555 [Planctomycetota bacterium]|nr:hypothetical protein [Planctomycetota bacterium]
MKKVFAVLAVVSLLTLTGCANGPIRNFFRGTACYMCGTGSASTCDTCNTTGHTSFAPGYEMVPNPGVDQLPNPSEQIGPVTGN